MSDRDFLSDDMKLIVNRFDRIEKKLDRLLHIKDPLPGDELLDNQDLCTLLGVTKRTLQRYRKKQILKAHCLDGRKPYYKRSELPDFLLAHLKK